MKLLPTLLITLGLLASPMVLAEEPPKHGEPGHDHAKDHGQEAAPQEAPKGDHAHDHNDGKHSHDDRGHSHDNEPHHGGTVAVVDDIHHELVIAEDGKVSLYTEGLPEGDALKTVKVRLTILKGKEKQEAEMTLAEGDKHRFDAPADIKLVAGDKVVAIIQTADGKPRMAKFEILPATTK